MRRAVAAAALPLLLAGCGARPQQAIGVSRGPTAHYLLCRDDRIDAVRLTSESGRVLWQRRFPGGSTRTAYRIPARPGAFLSGPDGKPAMQLTAIPSTGIIRGDGRRVTPAEFEEGNRHYCGAVRQDRAAAFAVGFALLVLAGLYATRWLRAKRSRDPYDRPYR
jgi:hypothetical protein